MKPLIVANWKMHFAPAKAKEVVLEILKLSEREKIDLQKVEIVLAPSFTALNEVAQALKDTTVKLGAQNCFWEEKGAFTGEISPSELQEIGVKYVIVGHSERRENLGETDEMIHKKIKTVLNLELAPILCVGETFEERQKGIKDYRLMAQATQAFEGLQIKPQDKIVIAYEPVWVIGSGQAVAKEEAQYTIEVLKQRMIDLFGVSLVKETTTFIYGGSVDESNIRDFVAFPSSGVLVGGASLKAERFVKLIKKIL